MVMGFACFGDFVSFRSFHFGGFVSLFQVLVHASFLLFIAKNYFLSGFKELSLVFLILFS